MKIKLKNKKRMTLFVLLPFALITFLCYSLMRNLNFAPNKIEKEIKIHIDNNGQ